MVVILPDDSGSVEAAERESPCLVDAPQDRRQRGGYAPRRRPADTRAGRAGSTVQRGLADGAGDSRDALGGASNRRGTGTHRGLDDLRKRRRRHGQPTRAVPRGCVRLRCEHRQRLRWHGGANRVAAPGCPAADAARAGSRGGRGADHHRRAGPGCDLLVHPHRARWASRCGSPRSSSRWWPDSPPGCDACPGVTEPGSEPDWRCCGCRVAAD